MSFEDKLLGYINRPSGSSSTSQQSSSRKTTQYVGSHNPGSYESTLLKYVNDPDFAQEQVRLRKEREQEEANRQKFLKDFYKYEPLYQSSAYMGSAQKAMQPFMKGIENSWEYKAMVGGPMSEAALRTDPKNAAAREERYRQEWKLYNSEQKKEAQNRAPGSSYLTGGSLSSPPSYGAMLQQKEAPKQKESSSERTMNLYERGLDGYVPKVIDDYYGVRSREDFDEQSQNREFGNASPEVITRNQAKKNLEEWAVDGTPYLDDDQLIRDPLGAYLNTAQPQRDQAMMVSPEKKNILDRTIEQGMLSNWNQLDQQDVSTYYYLMNTEGQTEAMKFLDDMKPVLDKRQYEADMRSQKAAYDSASGMKKVGMNLATVPMQMLGSVTGAMEDAIHTAKGEDINPYSGAHAGRNFSENIRGLTAQDIEKATGGAAIPGVGFTLGDLYQSGMSILDMAAGTIIGPKAYAAVMGTGAATSEAKRLYEQGASKGQIAAGSMLAGAAELIFEKVSIDNLIHLKDPHSILQVTKNALAQGGIEASEEAATEMANIITNAIVMGQDSDWEQMKKEYGGDWGAFMASLRQVTNSALGGFFSGAPGGGTSSMAKYAGIQSNAMGQARDMSSQLGGVDSFKNVAGSVSETADPKHQAAITKALTQVERAQNADKFSRKKQTKAVAKLYDAVQVAAQAQTEEEVTRAKNNLVHDLMTQDGFSRRQAQKMAEEAFSNPLAYMLNASDAEVNLAGFANASAEKGAASFRAQQTESISEAAKKYGTHASAMEGTYIRGQNVEQYDLAYGLAYEMGRVGADKKKSLGNESLSYLTPEQREAAYETGASAAKLDAVQDAEAFEVSAEGKSIQKSTGEDVQIQGIASIRNGKMMLKTEAGKTVSAEDVSFASEDDAVIYHAVSELPVNADTANHMVEGFHAEGQTMSAGEYSEGLREAYKAGAMGYPMRDADRGMFSGRLAQSLRQQVYAAGQSTRTATKKTAPKKTTLQGGSRVLFMDGGKTQDFRQYAQEKGLKLNKQQATAITAMEQFAASLGIDCYVYESRMENGKRVYTNESGKTVKAPNGKYKDGRIYIDLHAGNNASGLMLYTMGHELTHFIAEWSPEKFKVLTDLLMKEYAAQGLSAKDLVREQIIKAKENGESLTEEEAFEEFVADSMEGILRDGKVSEFMAEVKKQDQSLWEKIKGFFEDMAQKIRELIDAYKGVKPDSQEGRTVLEMKDALAAIEQAFSEGLVEAGDNLSRTEVQSTDTESSSAEKFQYRGLNKDGIEVYETSPEVLRLSKSEKIKKYLNEMKSLYRNRTAKFERNGHTYYARFDPRSIRKPVFGDNRSSPAGVKAFVNAAADGDIFALSENTSYTGSRENTKDHTNADYFDYFVKDVQIDGKVFSLYADVEKHYKASGGYVYTLALKDNKKRKASPALGTPETGPVKNAGDTFSTINVTQQNTTVKEKNSARSKSSAALERQNARLQEDIQNLRALLRLQGKTTGGKLVGKTTADSMAKQIKKETGATGNTGELSSLLYEMYNHIAQDEDITWDTVRGYAEPAAKWIEDHTQKKLDPYAQEVLDFLKGSQIALSPQQKAEAAFTAGSLPEFRKAMTGTFIFSDKNGTALDALWKDWATRYPDFFDSEISSSEMPAALMDSLIILNSMDANAGEFADYAHQDLIQKIYDSYWDAAKLKTVADRKQEKIDTVKGKLSEARATITEKNAEIRELVHSHNEVMRQTEKTYRSEYMAAEKQHRKELKELKDEHRAEVAWKTQMVATKYQNSRREAVNSRNRTVTRHKIQRVVDRLNSMLLHESKTRHIPEGLKDTVASALEAVNMEQVDYQSKVQYYEDQLSGLREKLQAAKDSGEDPTEILNKIDTIAQRKDTALGREQTFKDKMASLREEYEKLQDEQDPLISSAYREEISELMGEMMKEIGDKPLWDMTQKQLDLVYDFFKALNKTISTANDTFAQGKAQRIDELSKKTIGEVRSHGNDWHSKNAIIKGAAKFGWQNLKPVYAFELIGSDTMSGLFRSVRRGEDTWAVDITDARNVYLENAKKHGFWNWDLEKKFDEPFKSASGLEFNLTLGQAMSIYAYSKRQAAKDHLRIGGIVLDEDPTAYNIDDGTLASIIEKLDEDQTAFVDALQTYLSDVMGAKGNEVSMAMYDIKLYKEKNYFPIKSAPQYMAKVREQQDSKAEKKLRNAGFSKAVTPKANNPMILGDFMEVWANHVNDMSMYHAFVLPMEDFYRVFNYGIRATETSAPVSVVSAIQGAYGDGAVQYITQLLKDLNGGARVDPAAQWQLKMMNMFKKGATFANISVMVQQPSAIARAMAMINPKYFVGDRFGFSLGAHDELWAECKTYAPVAQIKEMGYFDVGNGRSSVDYITAREYEGFQEKATALIKDSGYRDEALSKGAALADEVTWCGIWDACKRETLDKHPSMSPKSEEFLKLAGDRFTEVIIRTQVYDSVMSRSGMMRSKDTGTRMATAFMAEPTTTMNMVFDAFMKGKRGNKRYMAAAMGAVIGSIVLNSLLKAPVGAARDDDDDETWNEKFLSAFLGGITSNLNPLTYIPLVKDAVSIFSGWDVERADVTVISDLADAIKGLNSTRRGAYRKTEDLLGALGNIVGLPIKNVMRDLRSVKQAYDTLTSKQRTTGAGLYYAMLESIGLEKQPDSEQLYRAYMAGDKAHAKRVWARYDSDKKATAALKSAIKGHYTEDKKHPLNKEQTIKMLTDHCGMTREDAEAQVMKWTATVVHGIDYDDIKDKFIDGTISAEKAIDMEVKYGGYSREDAVDKVTKWKAEKETNIAYDHIKDAFISGRIKDTKAVEMQMTYGGKEKTDAEDLVREWSCERDTGIAYEDIKELFISGQMDEGKAAELQQKYGGKDKKEASETVTNWACERDTGIAYEDVEEAFVKGTLSEDKAINIRMQYGGQIRMEATRTVTKWSCEKETGIAYDDIRDKLVSGELNEAAAVNLRMIYGDYNQDDAERTVRQWACERDTGIKYEDIRGLYMTDDISRSSVENMYVTYGGYSPEDAAGRTNTFDFVKQHPSCKDISDSAVSKYQEFCEPAGVPGENYYDIWRFYNDTDSDYIDGKVVRNSKKNKVMDYINSLPLTVDQKDSVYLSFSWSRRYISRAPWH